jgi:mRNA-degrading endonuclease RelE of RelBE toxin-antitoxin system
VRAFDRPPIRRAVAALEHQALTETINRKPLREPLSTLPEATWQLRVGRYRVLFQVEGGTVWVLRVILKTGTTGESL